LHIVVCTKHAPDTAAKMTVDEAGNVSWGDAPLVINPWDEYAVEEAILLRDKHGGKITVISMGPEEAREALKHAVAMGCDAAIRVWDESFAGSDALATSYVLAQAIKKLGDVDLVLLGRGTVDSDTSQVGPALATRLGYAPLMYISKISEVDPDAKSLSVERLLEQGRQLVTSKLPAVIGTVKEINEPRYPSFIGIRKAAKLEMPVWDAAEIGAEAAKVGAAGSGVIWPTISAPPARDGEAEIIEADDVKDAAAILADKLIAERLSRRGDHDSTRCLGLDRTIQGRGLQPLLGGHRRSKEHRRILRWASHRLPLWPGGGRIGARGHSMRGRPCLSGGRRDLGRLSRRSARIPPQHTSCGTQTSRDFFRRDDARA
jgi:electron transfer flavoprotein beta subunit